MNRKRFRLIEYVPSWNVLFVSLLLAFSSAQVLGQCAGRVSSPAAVVDCAAREIPREGAASLDPAHPYTLAELIDVAEHHNPTTRTIWERAKQKARELGLAKAAYYPELEGLAVFGDERLINPFPKPLAPRGYVMVEIPIVRPEVALQYLIFDFGKREASVDSARSEKLAAGADLIQVNQAVAFRVASAYYQLVTAQERLQAAQDTLRTAQTTQDAAENRLKNGLATLPDVLNARAETSQDVFDEESADGDEKIARVTLTEAVGADPSPDIVIDSSEECAVTGQTHHVYRGPDPSRHGESSRTDGPSSANPIRRGTHSCCQGRVQTADPSLGIGCANIRVARFGLRPAWFRKRANLVRGTGHPLAHFRRRRAQERTVDCRIETARGRGRT